MLSKLTLRLCTVLLLVSFGSSASACGLFPFLNPFAWCGYGGYGYGYGCGYRSHGACCYGGYGYRGYGYRGHGWGGYGHGWGHGYGYGNACCDASASVYTPGSPMVGSASNCDCGPGHGATAAAGTAWSAPGVTTPSTAWSNPGGWSPQRAWTPPGTTWQSQPYPQAMTSHWQAPAQTAMSTAPVYGPVYEVPGPGAPANSRVAGDILGDHETPVIPNGYQPVMGAPIHRASFQAPQFPRPRVHRYTGVVH